MAEASRALSVPVIGGNVSLYNESDGVDIDPSPVVGTVGLVDSLDRRPPGIALVGGCTLVVLGEPASTLSGSAWAWAQGHRRGTPPQVDLATHRRTADLVRDLVGAGRFAAVHDLAGGFGPALAEMVAAGGVGVETQLPEPGGHFALFGETPSAVIAAVDPGQLEAVRSAAAEAGVSVFEAGRTGGDHLRIGDLVDLPVTEVVHRWRSAIPAALGSGTLH
jgi:phosphoribosylformylglycinamidine synthase